MQNTKPLLHQTIVEHALEMFRTQGIKAVRMDDVAKSLKISKRTLYEQFVDKEQLLLECIRLISERQKKVYGDFMAQSNDVMEMLCFFIKYNLEDLSHFNVLFFTEVIKYKPAREFLEQINKDRLKEREVFIKRGIEEGLIVADINFPLLSRINKAAFDYLINEKIYEEYTLAEIFRTFVMVFLRGILTEKGQQKLDSLIGNHLKLFNN